MIYQPKGGMCMTCIDAKKDCTRLPFATMPVIVKLNSFTMVVKCTEHKPKPIKSAPKVCK